MASLIIITDDMIHNIMNSFLYITELITNVLKFPYDRMRK